MSLRPTGVTVSALVLGWLALGGVANAALRSSSDPVLGILALSYAATAGVAAVGLWRLRPFGITAFRTWAGVIFLSIAWLTIGFGLPWLHTGLFAVVAASVLFQWHRYLRMQLAAAG